MSLEDLVGAIRATDGDDPELAAVTQLRVRRSLETCARSRHRLVGVMTTVAVLFGGTAAWALATGRAATLWAPAPRPREEPAESVPPAPPMSRHRLALAIAPEPVMPPETVPPPETRPVSPPPSPSPSPSPRPHPPRPSRPFVEVLYRKAHDLHFHGGDPAAALAAWEAYLASEPAGRFTVEARYNRAILLVRLGRYADARAALVPFAQGEVEPVGYRQAEAVQLVARLASYE